MSDFDTAEFYDARDNPESLGHASVEEAIEDRIDTLGDPKLSIEATIRALAPFEVVAWSHLVVGDDAIQRAAARAVERIDEDLSEEFGDPEDENVLSDEDEAAIFAAINDVLKTRVGGAAFYRCFEVGRRTFDAEEVIAMMREHRADWFEIDDLAAASGGAQ